MAYRSSTASSRPSSQDFSIAKVIGHENSSVHVSQLQDKFGKDIGSYLLTKRQLGVFWCILDAFLLNSAICNCFCLGFSRWVDGPTIKLFISGTSITKLWMATCALPMRLRWTLRQNVEKWGMTRVVLRGPWGCHHCKTDRGPTGWKSASRQGSECIERSRSGRGSAGFPRREGCNDMLRERWRRRRWCYLEIRDSSGSGG